MLLQNFFVAPYTPTPKGGGFSADRIHFMSSVVPLCSSILLVLMFLLPSIVYAENTGVSVGLGGEVSSGATVHGNRVYDIGGGWTGAAEYRFNDFVSGGLKVGTSTDFYKRLTVFKHSIFARMYFLRLNKVDLFAEISPGALVAVLVNEVWASLEISFTAGARFSLGNWYVEPYFNVGYPIWGGIGVMVGYRIPLPRRTADRNGTDENRKVEPGIEYVPDSPAQETEQSQGSGEDQEAAAFNEPYPLIPSYYIIFPPNRMDFIGLDPETEAENSRNLRDIENTLKAHPEYRVLIEGYANPTEGTAVEERNELEPLSRGRAEVVATILTEAGVDRKQLIIAGSGGLRLVSPVDGDGKYKNRRVELTLTR